MLRTITLRFKNVSETVTVTDFTDTILCILLLVSSPSYPCSLGPSDDNEELYGMINPLMAVANAT